MASDDAWVRAGALGLGVIVIVTSWVSAPGGMTSVVPSLATTVPPFAPTTWLDVPAPASSMGALEWFFVSALHAQNAARQKAKATDPRSRRGFRARMGE